MRAAPYLAAGDGIADDTAAIAEMHIGEDGTQGKAVVHHLPGIGDGGSDAHFAAGFGQAITKQLGDEWFVINNEYPWQAVRAGDGLVATGDWCRG